MALRFIPAIDPKRTGENIAHLHRAAGLSVRDLQSYLGFESPQSVYKWQQGKNRPSIDNLIALSALFGVSVNEIVVCDSCEKEENAYTNWRILLTVLLRMRNHYSWRAATREELIFVYSPAG